MNFQMFKLVLERCRALLWAFDGLVFFAFKVIWSFC